jgi:hypothetical protein
MKTTLNTTWIYLIAGLILVGFIVFYGRERFQPEFLDKSQVQKTVSVEHSSYNQTTNHLRPDVSSIPGSQGVPTPFQVNQYTALM